MARTRTCTLTLAPNPGSSPWLLILAPHPGPHPDPHQVFSVDDVLTLRFTTATNRAGRATDAGELYPEEVEALLEWSPHTTGATFVANWSEDSTELSVRVTEAGESRPAPTDAPIPPPL